MKWIDQQDDYFLRDYNDKNGDATSDNSAPAGGADSSSSSSATSSQGEFSFPSSSTTSTVSATSVASQQQPVGPSQPVGPRKPRRHRGRKILAWFIVIVVIVLGGAFWLRYCVPYTEDTLTSGYITNVEKRGLIFKTYEGEMITQSHINDTSRVYERDFMFSIPDDEMARRLQALQGTGKRVTLTTERYYGTLPWRGSQPVIVTGFKVD